MTWKRSNRAIRNGEKPLPSPRRLLVRRPIGEVMLDYLAWGRTQGGRAGAMGWAERIAQRRIPAVVDRRAQAEAAGRDSADDVEKVVQKMLKSGHYAPKSVALRVEALRSFCLWSCAVGISTTIPLPD